MGTRSKFRSEAMRGIYLNRRSPLLHSEEDVKAHEDKQERAAKNRGYSARIMGYADVKKPTHTRVFFMRRVYWDKTKQEWITYDWQDHKDPRRIRQEAKKAERIRNGLS